jgi:hypothetical protein
MDIRELEDFKLSDAIKFHDELNPALWEDGKLRPEVRKQLLLIADDFLSELGISGLKVKDITISGSNAAYTYTPYSDLDLHILVDFNLLSNDDIYQELFTAKKSLYNDSHDIKVHGVPVELYVQDSNQPVVSIGEYSLKDDDWLRYPSKRKANFNQSSTRAKYEKLGNMIELALKSNSISQVEKVLKIIKQYRKAGLEKTGEFGPENLAFKALRNMGLIKKLYDYKNKLHSKELSIENVLESTKSNFIEGTNCINCVWWKKDSEKPVGKDELNNNGGLKPPNKEYIAMSKRVDLVTLPGKDTNVKVKAFCYHKDINDWVTERMCCAKWDAKGVIRDYKGESPLMEEELEEASGYIPSEKEKTDSTYNVNENIEKVDELLDPTSAYDITWSRQPHNQDTYDEHRALAKDQKGKDLEISFYDFKEYDLTAIEFSRGTSSGVFRSRSYDITKDGEQLNVFSTVLKAIKQYISSEDAPNYIVFSAKEKSRAKLYQAFVNRFANQFGYKQIPADNIPDDVKHMVVSSSDVAFLLVKQQQQNEASGYIPSQKEKNDPRFKTALTVDVKPDSIKKNAKAFGFKVSRAGIPPLLRK